MLSTPTNKPTKQPQKKKTKNELLLYAECFFLFLLPLTLVVLASALLRPSFALTHISHTHAQIHLLFCFLVVFLPLLTEIAKENTKNEMKLNCKITRHILPLNLLNSI